jgi:hypothetical protein
MARAMWRCRPVAVLTTILFASWRTSAVGILAPVYDVTLPSRIVVVRTRRSLTVTLSPLAPRAGAQEEVGQRGDETKHGDGSLREEEASCALVCASALLPRLPPHHQFTTTVPPHSRLAPRLYHCRASKRTPRS